MYVCTCVCIACIDIIGSKSGTNQVLMLRAAWWVRSSSAPASWGAAWFWCWAIPNAEPSTAPLRPFWMPRRRRRSRKRPALPWRVCWKTLAPWPKKQQTNWDLVPAQMKWQHMPWRWTSSTAWISCWSLVTVSERLSSLDRCSSRVGSTIWRRERLNSLEVSGPKWAAEQHCLHPSFHDFHGWERKSWPPWCAHSGRRARSIGCGFEDAEGFPNSEGIWECLEWCSCSWHVDTPRHGRRTFYCTYSSTTYPCKLWGVVSLVNKPVAFMLHLESREKTIEEFLQVLVVDKWSRYTPMNQNSFVIFPCWLGLTWADLGQRRPATSVSPLARWPPAPPPARWGRPWWSTTKRLTVPSSDAPIHVFRWTPSLMPRPESCLCWGTRATLVAGQT